MANSTPFQIDDLVIERRFPSPLKKMFGFVTQTRHLLSWWGPKDVHIGENNLDLLQRGPF